ncbi:MAG: PTS sugar transporter subunit IIC [Elusimicrobiaceae bacterium]|nr:PTS sugar transporter subunit IIC [Elusimicrobiaceae bacterium]
MTTTIILLCLLASVLELDVTYAFQTLVSRPIIAGPLFGLCAGDLMAGVQVGIFAELLFLDISPLGGIIPPSGVVAVVIPIILHSLGIELYFGFFLGVLLALLYSLFDTLLRKTRFRWLVFLETKIGKNPNDLWKTVSLSLLLSFLMTFIFLSAAAWLSAQLVFWIFPYIPAQMHFAFQLAYMAVPWIGLATLIPLFRLKTR